MHGSEYLFLSCCLHVSGGYSSSSNSLSLAPLLCLLVRENTVVLLRKDGPAWEVDRFAQQLLAWVTTTCPGASRMFPLRLLTRAKGAGALPPPVDEEAEVRDPVRQISVLGRVLQAVSSPACDPGPCRRHNGAQRPRTQLHSNRQGGRESRWETRRRLGVPEASVWGCSSCPAAAGFPTRSHSLVLPSQRYLLVSFLCSWDSWNAAQSAGPLSLVLQGLEKPKGMSPSLQIPNPDCTCLEAAACPARAGGPLEQWLPGEPKGAADLRMHPRCTPARGLAEAHSPSPLTWLGQLHAP